ncbi:MAG: tetratricopeptide repeat protein [Chloroflexi bacterium]|nr:tetratricopeptide repeat protein [Chloroflexota bacterium]
MLKPSCPSCGHQAVPGSKFCSQCGTRLPKDPLPPAALSRKAATMQNLRALMPEPLAEKVSAAAIEIVGERREVTVLFLDIVNFTATAHILDSEDVYLWTDKVMRLLAEVIYKYEGSIDKYTGDGLMALFGMPVAHENDAERAVRAALEIVDVLQPLQQQFQHQYNLDLEIRIGINTGLVIAGKIGSDLHVEYTVIGNTVNLANRLQSIADSGTVAVSFATYQRTQPFFEYQTLLPSTVKGKPQPIGAFRPLELRAKPGQVRGLSGLRGPMIGRQNALARLQSALAQVRQHQHSQVVLITGEAGVGKSRLVDEFRRSVAQSDVSFYQGVCLTYARSNPLRLLANVLRDIMHLTEADPAEVQHETVQTYLQRLGLADNDVLPYVINILGLEQPDSAIKARLRHFDNTVLQKLIHAALRRIFLAEADLAPTILVFDDLHWIDPASSDFLEHLIQTTDDAPLLLVLVSREAERETVVEPLIAAVEQYHEPLTDIKLKPLSQVEGQLLVDQLLQHATDEALSVKQRIVERAEGNPFYAEEIIRMLIEQDGLARENGGWHVTPQASDLLQQVPGTLNGLIMARFDRLPQDHRRTLQMASVLGSTFPVDLLQELGSASSEIIAGQLSELEARQLLITLPFGLGQSYAFRHALIQEVVYDTLLKRDRQKIHEQAALAIDQGTFWLPHEKAEALAHHYVESSDPARAVPYLIEAAENAGRRCANETAIHHYRQALVLIRDQSTSHSDHSLRVELGMGQALKFVGQFSEASQMLEKALQYLLPLSIQVKSIALLPILIHSLKELADIRMREGALDTAIDHLQAGLDALGGEGTKTYPHLWRLLIDRLAWVRFRQGDLEKAFALASSATLGLDLETGDDPMTLASLHNTLGGVFWQWGNLPEAANYVESSLELYQNTGYAWGMAIAYTNLGVLHYVQGLWPKAVDYFEHAYTLRRENGYLPEQALNLSNLSQLRIAMGEHAQARKDLETGLAISQRLGEGFGIVLAQVGLAQLAVTQSRFQDAIAHIDTVMNMSEAAGEHQIAHARWLLALAQAGMGDLQTGLETAAQALEMTQTSGLAETETECRRVLGTLHARAGDYLEAETLLREAVDLSLQLNAPYSRGQALFELGCLYESMARIDDPARVEWRTKALTVLDEAVEQFERLGAARDLQNARATLSQLEAETAAKALFHDSRDADRVEEPLPEAEWHTVAVVWLSLRPPQDADEEVVFETIAFLIPALTAIVQEQQGQVIRHQDGLTVIFGAPTAYEDDVERAVQTARLMLQHLGESTHQIEIPLTVGVGVSQGQVVAGQIGPQFHSQFTVTGEAVQTAQLLAESAPMGQVWVTEAVQAKTERLFIYEPALSDIASTLTLVGVREEPSPARGLPGLRAKLIGRDASLQAMVDLVDNLTQGIGGLIWIEGEPGIGKSRLMEEFAALTMESGALFWTGTSFPQKSDQAFSLFSHLIFQALNLQPTSTPDQIHARINQTLQSWPRDARMARSYLEMLLGLRPSGLEGERLASLEPEQLRQQTFVALRRLFRSLAHQQPMIILLDDLHWIDPMSAELLLFLVTMVTLVPILFVCAQRRQGADSPNDRLVRVQSLIPTQTVHLPLQRLSVTESEILLSELLPKTEMPTALRRTILEQSEGNPYFIEEYVRMLIEYDYLQHHQGRWSVNADQDIADLPVPSSLEVLIRSRIDALPPDLKQLLQEATFVSSPFEIDLLEAISELSDVRVAVKRLESRLLVRRGTESNQWQFNHPLIEAVAYGMLLKARRKELHLKVGQVLEKCWAGVETNHAEELAYHFSQTDQGTKALKYLVMAGERATAQFANEEAIAYLEQAAQLLGTEPNTPDHTRWSIAVSLGDAYRSVGKYADSIAILKAGLAMAIAEGLSEDLQASLYRRLGNTARRQGEMEAARGYFDSALAILNQFTDRQSQTEVARSLTGVAWTHFLQGHFDQARQACEASSEVARSAGTVAELASAENLLGGIHYRQSEWIPALHHTTRAMVLREQVGYTWGVASTLGNLGVLAVLAGHWNKAQSFFERCLALQQDIGNVAGLAIAHNNVGSLARDQGKLDLAEDQFRKSLNVATPFNMGFHIANSSIGLAQVLLLKGEIEDAQKTITASFAQAGEIGAEDALAEIYQTQAEILLAMSQWDEAKTAAEKAASLAAEKGNRSLEAVGWRVASEIELGRENPRAARELLTKSQSALSDTTNELEAGRVAAQAGRISIYEGQYAQAEADLRAAKEVFMRLGAGLDLKRVKVALKQPSMLNAITPRTPTTI